MRVLDSPLRSPTRHIKKCSSERTLIGRKAQLQINEIMDEISEIIADADHFTNRTAGVLDQLLRKAETIYAKESSGSRCDDFMISFDVNVIYQIRSLVAEAKGLPMRIVKANSEIRELLDIVATWTPMDYSDDVARSKINEDLRSIRRRLDSSKVPDLMKEVESCNIALWRSDDSVQD